MIKANDPSLKSWIEVEKDSDFPIQNLPFGVFKTNEEDARVGSRIGNKVIDLNALYVLGYLENLPFKATDFKTDALNPMMKKGKAATRDLRNRLSKLFNTENDDLSSNKHHVDQVLIDVNQIEMLMPVQVGDYTDFYSSEGHATNVGTLFRDPDNALLPNWKWIPVGYHGRASSIIPSLQEIKRPKGQQKPNDDQDPVFGPCKLLDFELEMAFVTYDGKPLGENISTDEAKDYIFGMCIMNDWSARDIQKWEYVPLGPFLAKSFASSISPWIVTMDALEPFKTKGPKQDPEVLPYLAYKEDAHYDIDLEVGIIPENSEETTVCKSNYKYMYWNMSQQLAHHTVNGCNVRCGDMMASGTISGEDKSSFGSMLELTWRGSKPIKMKDGSERKFINDKDTVVMRGHCQANGVRIGFGEVVTKVLPAD
ncbi:fumarylacetoacetase [Brumimicrobium salinarum]|uniref:fumarylacetoacetase n=1 Tax=Brumimicrobium salinarum TaxID=2058658 RepID=A0A2I0R4U4_9FLAO|nr:fumarylacetoacetase [Brumimicrobium salinarum]PKR81595.1 fumarylacetoacetase [Brumimicrobium salinarum]